jgi:hypothetical protein
MATIVITPTEFTVGNDVIINGIIDDESVSKIDVLKRDIEINGQLDPVTTYRGKIVDGRHRWLIIQELGIDEIKYIKLANNATLADIRQVVQSKELRRHETASQLAIRAYRMKSTHDSKFKSSAEVAKAIGANPKRIVEVKKVVELYGRNDIIDLLFNGKKFNVGTHTIPFWTDSLGTILRWLEEHGTIIDAKQQVATIEPRKELTEDEETLVNSYVNTLSKESELVRQHISDRLYDRLKEVF